ncbi:hypothetical protein ACNKHW_26850 [Shigella flexneri]
MQHGNFAFGLSARDEPVKAVVVLCVLIVQSQRFISLIKGVRSHDKT